MKHRDFVTYVRNGVEINALVAVSQTITTPATQEKPAFTTEHLTLVYLDPASEAARMTGDQLRASIKTVFDVAPLVEGAVNGWKEIPNLTAIATDRGLGSHVEGQPASGGIGGHPGNPNAETIAVGTGPATPSAADLDAAAAEEAAKAATSTDVDPADVVQIDPAIAEAVANPAA